MWITRELQFRVCNHAEPHASLHVAREGEHFNREEKEVGRPIVDKESMIFHWLSVKKRSISSPYWALLPLQRGGAPFWSPNYLIEVSVYSLCNINELQFGDGILKVKC